jgi:hypothetical protein
MIFQATWQAVLDGTQTESRRIVKPGEVAVKLYPGIPSDQTIYEVRYHGRTKWRIFNTYAIQTGRGNPGLYYKRTATGLSVWDWDSLPQSHMPRNIKTIPLDYIPGRILLLEIRQEHLQDITEAGAKAEGCSCIVCGGSGLVPDKSGLHMWTCYACGNGGAIQDYMQLWNTIHTKRGERWDDNPAVWCLRFELVETAE